MAQTIDWNDAGVFELAGDLSLLNKSRPAVKVVGMSVLNFLECDPPVELQVDGDRDLPEPPFGVRTKDPEPSAR